VEPTRTSRAATGSFPARALVAGLAALAAVGCGGEPARDAAPSPPLPETFPGRLPNAASFLMDEAEIRIMNGLSAGLDEAEFRARVQACVDNRDDTIALYLTNRGDGVPPVTSFYVDDEYGGAVDPARVAAMRARIEHCRERSLNVHLWIWADDSGFGNVDDETHERHLRRCVELFDDLAAVWCVGLELDEVFGNRDRVAGLTAALRELTSRPVGVHFTSLDRWEWAVDAGADILFGQYGFGHDADRIRRDTEKVLRRLDGRVEFWAWEYHLSSRSAEAKALGDAAISVPGCRGTGNGRTLERGGTS
jgi:hypothetical protein